MSAQPEESTLHAPFPPHLGALTISIWQEIVVVYWHIEYGVRDFQFRVPSGIPRRHQQLFSSVHKQLIIYQQRLDLQTPKLIIEPARAIIAHNQ